MIGKTIKDFPPTAENPRNSEGSFVKLEDGTIIFAYSKFMGEGHQDVSKAYIAFEYSYDNGETFGDEKIMFSPDEVGAKNIMAVSFLQLDNCIIVAYVVRYGFHDLRLHIRKTYDQCKTFTELKCTIPYPGYYVTNNDRLVRLSNNSIIIPTAYHRCLHSDSLAWSSWDSRGVARFFVSEDEGETFIESKGFGALNIGDSNTGLQEPGVIEINKGHLLCYCRTDLGCQYLSHSYDYGKTWSNFSPSKFFSPTSPMSMKRIDEKRILAVYNPVPITPIANEGTSWGRTPLIGAISEDNGSTFSKFFMLENDKLAGFCYTAMYVDGDNILLSYCCGGETDGQCLNRIRIRKLSVQDIYNNLEQSSIIINT
ncbi:MAG: exo-alpha-sialidase [Clostridiales bacterium]|nr:exo-alpha-sialidase [Clostridiales bacterium]